MVGITDGDHADTDLLCLLNGHHHCLVTDHLTHAVICIQHSGNGGLKYHITLGLDLDHALLDGLVVTVHSLHTVALDTDPVGHQQHIADDLGFLSAEAELLEGIVAQCLQLIIFPILITHCVLLSSNYLAFFFALRIAMIRFISL